ncbi:MAG TPA: LysR family transcriptional regulator [Devosia sp.]|nr:LysR family transcriptional regulator [Devosia sp.]
MRINLNMDDLNAFAEVAQKLSYKAAADGLNISPSALSRRIQKLEESLNVQLFVRTTRDVKLTPAGKQLQRASRDIITNVEELLFALRGEGQRNSRIIRVGCVPSAMRTILLPAISRIIAHYPTAQVKVVDSTAVHILDALYQQEIDFCVNYLGQNENGVEFDPILDDPFVVAVRADHPFAKRKQVSWEDLTKQRTIAARHGAGLRMLMDVGLAKSRKRINWSYEVQHVNSALSLVNEGLGVAVVPNVCIAASGYANVIAVPLQDAHIARTLGLLRLSNNELRPLAAQLWSFVAEPFRPPAPVHSDDLIESNRQL